MDLDHIAGALKLSREAREASFKTGRALLGAYRDVFSAESLAPFAAAVRDRRSEGHQAGSVAKSGWLVTCLRDLERGVEA